MTNITQRLDKLTPEKRALLEQLLLKRRAQAPEEAPITRRKPTDPTPLSFAQQRLWFMDQLAPGLPTYNVAYGVRISGDLDIPALHRSLEAIVNRHEVLRTFIHTVDGQPVQVIPEKLDVPLPLVDFSPWAGAEQDERVQQYLLAEARRPFDLSKDPILRTTLLKLAEKEYILLVITHHIASDGWSKGVMFREMGAFYRHFTMGVPHELPELPIQYADYALWQQSWFAGEVFDKHAAYWRQKLAGAPPAIDLPLDFRRPPVQTFDGRWYWLHYPSELTERMKALCREEGATLFMGLLAAFQTFLHALSQQETIIVGSPIAGRHRVETEALIGFFVNTLVLRSDFYGNPTFREMLGRARETALEAYAHQDMPFERIVEVVRPPRDPSRNPIFQVNFRVQGGPPPSLTLPGLKLEMLEIETNTSKFDLAFELRVNPDSFGGYIEYNTQLFHEKTIVQMSQEFEALLGALLNEPDRPLKEMDILTEIYRRHRPMGRALPEQPRIKNFREARRKAVDISHLDLVKMGPLLPDQPLPLLIQPNVEGVDLAEWAGTHREMLEQKLYEHGAILFRGFGLKTVPEFERVVSAIYNEVYGGYGDLPRVEESQRLYKSTPYPEDKAILFHNESSHLNRWPMKISFFCVQASQKGGETPILDCRKVYRELDPKIRRRFEEKGLLYVRNFQPGIDVSWQHFFRTEDRAIAEQKCREGGMEFEWVDADWLRTRQSRTAVSRHPVTGEMTFFNQIQLHHIACLDAETRNSLLSLFKMEDLPRNVYYGDGTPIEDSVMEEIGELYWKLCITAPWQNGDMMMLDNMLTSHARLPYEGPRKIAVAMGDMIDAKDVG
jgi:alpha-ketoglutarate-dependent taurine dioxygenase